MQNYKILNLDATSTSNQILDNICTDLNMSCTHTIDKMSSLECLMDMEVDVIVVNTNIDCEEIHSFLEILTEDVQNHNTAIIIISDLDNNEKLIFNTQNFNVISILTYKPYHYQLKNLLKTLQSKTIASSVLKTELLQSETRNVVDPLTGAFNRYGAEDKFHFLTSRVKAYQEMFSLIMLDIDHFKKVNDTYGHDVGDEVLVGISTLIKNFIRSTDTLVRFGGEEFFVFLSNTDIEQAKMTAQKLRLLIKENPLSSRQLSITSSFGVVQYIENEDLESLIKRTDKLLYKAKASGRDIVIA